MSSGTPVNFAAVREVTSAIVNINPPANMGMNARQMHLHRLFSFFDGSCYDNRSVAWDGSSARPAVELHQVGYATQVPEGFNDPSGDTVLLRDRRPDSPYFLVRVIVRRFTGLLFSRRRHPRFVSNVDPRSARWANAVANAGRLWAHMIAARNLGGAMGCVGVGFALVRGRPTFEVFDPRWCVPTFRSHLDPRVVSLEKRYPFSKQVRDSETGEWVTAWYWYRRVIDDKFDTVWPEVPVIEGEEPRWQKLPCERIEHHLGECPVVWIQNTSALGTGDGDPDCHTTYDTVQTIDALTSQAVAGTIANCDPTLVLATKLGFDGVKKGSDNALKLEPGDLAQYLEMEGSGPRIAIEIAEKLEERVGQVARCVLERVRNAARTGRTLTATEASQDLAAMWEAADELREQYGENGIKPLMELVLRISRRLLTPVVDADGVRRVQILLPAEPPDANADESLLNEPLSPGAAESLELSWPDYEQPTVDHALKAAQAVKTAVDSGALDRQEAAEYVAPYFAVENVALMRERAEKERAARVAEENEAARLHMVGGGVNAQRSAQ